MGQEAAWNRFKEGGRRNRTVPKGIIKYLNCGFSSGEGHGPTNKENYYIKKLVFFDFT